MKDHCYCERYGWDSPVHPDLRCPFYLEHLLVTQDWGTMANHAHVINCKKPFDKKLIVELVQEFIDTRLKGMFHIELAEGDDGWNVLAYKDDKYMGVCFWIEDHYDWDEETEERIESSKQKCVSFRHGHGTDFMWWVDISLENFIAHKLEGQIIDDGVCEIMEPVLDKYPTVNDWICGVGLSEEGCKCRWNVHVGQMESYPELREAFEMKEKQSV